MYPLKFYHSIVKSLTLLLTLNLIDISLCKEPAIDVCSGDSALDLISRKGSVPWSVANDLHYIDISPCTTFNLSNYQSPIPNECKNSYICHKIKSEKSWIGYDQKYVATEFDTKLVTYVGPICDKDNALNYTIYIRYSCGNHLGRPTFPPFQVNSKCKAYLNWDTSSACKNNQSYGIGPYEMRCYVLDDQKKLRDLTPLIKTEGSYRVMSDGKQFFINVCADVTNKCQYSSACFTTPEGGYVSAGSYRWSDIKYVAKNGQTTHDHIEITYRVRTSKCSSFRAVTKIRFICPDKEKGMKTQKLPVLISDDDCEYIIEWITHYACPVEDIVRSADNCQFGSIDFKKLNQTEFSFDNVDKNTKMKINICGSFDKDCDGHSSVCLIKEDSQTSQSIASRKNTNFVSIGNHLQMKFTSAKPTCNKKYYNTIIDFECDPNDNLMSKPTFVGYFKSNCLFQFKWQTSLVCPLHDIQTCSYAALKNGQLVQVDLSSLRSTSFYKIHRSLHSNQEFQFNICDQIHSPRNLNECRNSFACLIDNNLVNHNKEINVGRFMQPLTYNQYSKSLEIVYTGGYDPIKKREISTKIVFVCQSYDSPAYFVDFDEKNSQYVIEFHTIASCPLHHNEGVGCYVIDEISQHVINLKPLQSSSYYVVKNDDSYEFELNVCSPVVGGSCPPNTAICQKELHSDRRNFSLGTFNNKIIYWNSMVNMTFTGGDPYNDKNHTPRKSHITFICDPSVEKGHPEFIGEYNRSYSFVWYTSLVCRGYVPKKSHCVFENETHFIDFNPLSLNRGNHFAINDNSIAYINFCRSLNRIGVNELQGCKANSAVCLLNQTSVINLGEPSEPPIMGYDGNVHIFYNNGDPCPYNNMITWTTDIQLHCDKNSGDDLNIMIVESDDRHKCTYEFIVYSPIACPQKLTDVKLDNCVYVDPRTKLSANFTPLVAYNSHEISTGRNSKFFLNICKPLVPQENCQNSAVCFQSAGQTLMHYGSADKLKIYFDETLHLRYSGGDRCDAFGGRTRSTDIEMVCNKKAKYSQPELVFYDDCLAKFKWETPAVCSLNVPSCSFFADNGDYYSLRPLSSLSHSWKVNSSDPEKYYLLNICKPLSTESCDRSSAICICYSENGKEYCRQSVGKVSDHELTLDPITKHLLLTYEEDELDCNGRSYRTQIQFQCINETGMDGPKFINYNDCTHYFIWKTSFACPHNYLHEDKVMLLNSDLHLHDHENNIEWDLNQLLSKSLTVPENRLENGKLKKYNYRIKFTSMNNSIQNDPFKNCPMSAVCQTDETGFSRDIGSVNNWKFTFDGISLNMIIVSNYSRCGRNHLKNVTSKFFFKCMESIESNVTFLYESDDCVYYFVWETMHICNIFEKSKQTYVSTSNRAAHTESHGRISTIFTYLFFIMLAILAFVIYRNYGTNIRSFVGTKMDMFRRTSSAPSSSANVNFRYQQLSL